MTAFPVAQPLTVGNIYAALEQANRSDLHPRLSASQLGGECERQIWDGFRWLFPPERFDGRKLSIFRTGEVWEERIVGMLRAADMEVDDVDPATGEQFRIVFAAGHASGRTDGKVRNVPEAPKTEHVLEVKSHNDRSFKDLLKKGGVREAKPAHFAQVQLYMHHQHLTRALYVCINKNDDTVYAERIEYDAVAALQLVAKAERLATQERRPSCTCPSYFLKAGYGCAPNDGLMPNRNCRTCLHATAHLDGDARWSCARWTQDLTLEEQRAGCPSHLFNPSLVPGEQFDADEAGEWVMYRLADGSVWKDGGVG
ncbi:hypothetical protein [Brevundimonas sp.]|uniref:hypothetical protein n=1 Tax=Brevundimonas sp. TaxID=1871086 RepID=UPI0025C70327|nr:hypothetical protein [Brevundimonas sp.]